MKVKAHTLILASALASAALVATDAQALSLKDTLEGAYETNPRLSASRSQLEATNEEVSRAISNWRPSVNAQYNYGRERARISNGRFNYESAPSTALTVEQPIFEGGTNFTRYSSALNSVMAERATLKNAEQSVLLNAVEAHMNVVEAYSVLELSKNNVDVLEQQRVASQERFDVGEVTRTDVAQSESRYALAEADRIQAQGDLVAALAEYERVVGFMPEEQLDMPEDMPELPASLEDATALAISKNPALSSAGFLAEAADDDTDTAIATLLPKVSVIGTMSRSKGASAFGPSDIDNDEVRLNVSIPLYQGGAEHSDIRQSKKLARQQEYTRKDTEEAVREATIQAWENWKTSLATISAQQEAINAAEIALDGVKQEQQYGARTVLDVLDAEQELFSTRVSLVRAQRDRIVAIYNLLLVLGELTAENLALNVDFYNPEADYDDVKWQFIGW